jgi:hypothetical protein
MDAKNEVCPFIASVQKEQLFECNFFEYFILIFINMWKFGSSDVCKQQLKNPKSNFQKESVTDLWH